MQANKNGHTKVFASRGTRQVQMVVPNETEHITILRRISTICQNGATIDIQKKGWMDAHLFALWMDGYKSHISLEVLQKARINGLDMISLPFVVNHALQPLDMVYFGSFKKALGIYGSCKGTVKK